MLPCRCKYSVDVSRSYPDIMWSIVSGCSPYNFQDITMVVPGWKALILGSNYEFFIFWLDTISCQSLKGKSLIYLRVVGTDRLFTAQGCFFPFLTFLMFLRPFLFCCFFYLFCFFSWRRIFFRICCVIFISRRYFMESFVILRIQNQY